MRFLKQSTSVDVGVGPFLDETDGKTAETALTITQPDIRLKKNNGNWAQKAAAQTLTHEENGWYELTLDATDTDTVGILLVAIHESGALPVWCEFHVLEEAIYDALFAASANAFSGAAGSTALTALASGSITAAVVATGAIDADAIADNAIDAGALAADCITAAKIATGAITSAKFAAGAIDAAAIADNAIDVGALAADCITAAKIADGAIDANTFAAGAITAAAIAADAIGASELAADAITEIQAGLSTLTAAQVQTECEEALQTYHLDHFIASADPGGVVANSSFLAKLTSKSATPAFSSYDNTTDSLEAIRDRGDVAWITATSVIVSAGGITASSFAAGAIDAAAIAADAIGSSELAASAVTEIQSGLSTLDAAGVRTAVGLASANLDTQLAAIQADLPTRITKNVALSAFEFFMVDSADHITGKTGLTITAQRSIDGGAFAACTNAATEVANGVYKIDLAAADLNGNVITLKFTATGADARLITIVTQPT